MTTQQILQGVHDWTNGKIVYDISAAHPDGQGKPTPYADLTAALGTGGANIPQGLRKGGMSVKFIKGSVQSSDNKYVQYRLMADSWSTTESDWQGVDDAPTAGSDNLVKSGGVSKALSDLKSKIFGNVNEDVDTDSLVVTQRSIQSSIATFTNKSSTSHSVIPVEGFDFVNITANDNRNARISFLSEYSAEDALSDDIELATIHYATGYSSYVEISSTKSNGFDVPSDAKFLYIQRMESSSDLTPASITLKRCNDNPLTGIQNFNGIGAGATPLTIEVSMLASNSYTILFEKLNASSISSSYFAWKIQYKTSQDGEFIDLHYENGGKDYSGKTYNAIIPSNAVVVKFRIRANDTSEVNILIANDENDLISYIKYQNDNLKDYTDDAVNDLKDYTDDAVNDLRGEVTIQTVGKGGTAVIIDDYPFKIGTDYKLVFNELDATEISSGYFAWKIQGFDSDNNIVWEKYQNGPGSYSNTETEIQIPNNSSIVRIQFRIRANNNSNVSISIINMSDLTIATVIAKMDMDNGDILEQLKSKGIIASDGLASSSFSFSINNKSSFILECQSYIATTGSRPTIQFKIPDSIYKSPKFYFCNGNEVELKEWRVPPSLNNEKAIAEVTIPSECQLYLQSLVINKSIPTPADNAIVRFDAHLGLSGYAPRNTNIAFQLAASSCFTGCIANLRFTSDNVAVCIHNETINATARNLDGTTISETISVADNTYQDLLNYNYNCGYENFTFCALPTFEEFVRLCAKTGMKPMVSCNMSTITDAQWLIVKNILKKYNILGDFGVKSYNTNILAKAYNNLGDNIDTYLYDTNSTDASTVLSNWNNTGIPMNSKCRKVIEYTNQIPQQEQVQQTIDAGFIVSAGYGYQDGSFYEDCINIGITEFSEDYNCCSGLNW